MTRPPFIASEAADDFATRLREAHALTPRPPAQPRAESAPHEAAHDPFRARLRAQLRRCQTGRETTPQSANPPSADAPKAAGEANTLDQLVLVCAAWPTLPEQLRRDILSRIASFQ